MQSKKKTRVVLELGVSLFAISILAACGGGGGEGGEGGGAIMPSTTGILQSLTITPATSSAAACTPVNFTATGYYSDNTSANVTSIVVWQIDPANSDVAIANATIGQVMGINPGSATVFAWTGNISASAVLNVSSGNLSAIAVTPASATVAVNGTQLYTATATCSTGSADISNMSIWTSGNSAVATVSTSGMATAIAAGSSVVAAVAGPIAGSAVLNVQ